METFAWIAVLCIVTSHVTALSVTVCEQKLDTIYCQLGVIQVDSVLYGRTQNNVCNSGNAVYANLNCRSTQVSLNAVRTNCQGRTTCLLQASNSALHEDPCPGQGKYLQIQYRCVPRIVTQPVTNPTTRQPVTTQKVTAPTTPSTRAPTTQSGVLPTGVLQIGGGLGPGGSGNGSPGGSSGTSPGNTSNNNNNISNSSSRAVQMCHDFLVSGPKGVPDSQLSASSQLGLANNVHRGRLHLGIDKKSPTFSLEGGWTADPTDTQPWIQVKMNWLAIVQGVVTQGRHVNTDTNCCLEWVTRYMVHYSVDGTSWDTVKDAAGNVKVFVGNTDSDTVITQMFDCPVTARFIKLEVVNYSGAVSLRLDIIGCPTNSDDIGVCPKGWKERPNTGKCYFISNRRDLKTWEEGQLMCKRRQGDIVKIDDLQEKIWLRNELLQLQMSQNLQNWWIGLNNRPRFDNSYYKWDDGTPFSPTAVQWDSGEPNNSGGVEHCAHYNLISDALNDRSCDLKLPFICEIDKYWTPPINVPVIVTAQPTQPSTKIPVTVKPNLAPVPIGGGQNVISTGANIFTTGCLRAADCAGKAWGDYASCDGCHYFLTCAPNGNFRRSCPLNLKFDANLGMCSGRSSTCTGP